MVKHILITCTFFGLLSFSCFAETDTSITINRVKIVINGSTYIWETKDEIPGRQTNEGTAPYTVISSLYIWPGQIISEQNLLREIALARHRLIQSVYFYTVDIDIIPPHKFPEKRTILIKVTDGFAYRFGGDNLYGYFGMENLWGTRKSFRLFAGYNKCGGYFLDQTFLESNTIIGAGAYYKNSGLGVREDEFYEQLQASLTTGIWLHPDWLISLETVGQRVWYPTQHNADSRELLLIPRLHGRLYCGYDSFPLIIDNTIISTLIFQEKGGLPLMTIHPFIQINWTFAENHAFFIKLAAGYSFDRLPLHHKYNLYDKPNLAVRSGYEDSELRIDAFALASIEYRLTIFSFTIPPIFKIQIQPFLFADFALAGEYRLFEYLNTSELTNFYKDAYGAGLNIIFANPVFLTVSLACGWNNQGQGRFIYAFTGDL